MARRRIARSMADNRSKRQLSQCLPMISSRAVTSLAAPSKSWFAKARVASAALALFQNFASSLAGSCWLMSHWKSICIANSRDFVRRDTLLAPPWARRSSRRRLRFGRTQLARKLRHFHCRQPRFKSFVPALEPRAIDGLLQRVAGQHAENNGQPGIDLRELQAARGFGTNIIVMRSFAAQNAANGNQRVVFPGGGKFFCRQGQFERTGNMDHIHIFAISAPALQRIRGGGEQAVGDKAVEAADDDSEA